jgi:hypothetical protein
MNKKFKVKSTYYILILQILQIKQLSKISKVKEQESQHYCFLEDKSVVVIKLNSAVVFLYLDLFFAAICH